MRAGGVDAGVHDRAKDSAVRVKPTRSTDAACATRAFGQDARRDVRAGRSCSWPAGRRACGAASSTSRSSQDDPRYYRALARLSQSAAAEERACCAVPSDPIPQLLAVYDAALVENGTQIVLARERFDARAGRAARGRARAVHARAAKRLDGRLRARTWRSKRARGGRCGCVGRAAARTSRSANAAPKRSRRRSASRRPGARARLANRWPRTVRRASSARRCWR